MQSKKRPFPEVSVIIISKDRREDLNKCLTSIKELDYPQEKLEIVVVEEGDKPREIPGVRCIFIPRENKGFGFARNFGVRNATGEIAAFTDDDCLVAKDWLKELISCFDNRDVKGAAGGVLVKDCNSIGYCETILGFPGGGLKKIFTSNGKVQFTKHLSTCNCAYRKNIFEKMGYFKLMTKYSGEDYEFAQRVSRKYLCLYNPKALVYHRPRGGFIKIFKWFIRRGIEKISHLYLDRAQFGFHLSWNVKNSIFLRLVLLIILLTLAKLNKPLVYLSFFMLYYLVIVWRYKFSYQYFKKLGLLFLTPLVKMTMDLGMEIGRFIGIYKFRNILRREAKGD